MEIIADSSKTKYLQLKEMLLKKIKSGKIKPGEYLPSEGEIQKRYGISRTPVRKALAELEQEGFVKKEMGKGTIVISTSKVTQRLPKLASFAEDMKSKGLNSDYRLIDVSLESIPGDLKSRLKENEYENLKEHKFFLFKRLMLADDKPMALHQAYLSGFVLEEKFSEIKENLSRGKSLYKTLASYGIELAQARQFVGAETADRSQAEILNIAEGDPLIIMDRLTYDINNNLIEFVKGYYRADRYEYTIDMAVND